MSRRSTSSWSRWVSSPRADSTYAMATSFARFRSVRGSWGRKPKAPVTVTRPLVGGRSPPSVRSSVVLPAPLRPTSPTLSPGYTENDASSTSTRSATSIVSSCPWITAVDGTGWSRPKRPIFGGNVPDDLRRLSGCLESGDSCRGSSRRRVPPHVRTANIRTGNTRTAACSRRTCGRSARAVGLAILLLASQLVPLAEPLLLKGFVDRATAGEALAILVAIALAYIGVALVAQVLSVVVSRSGTILAWRVTDRMRSDVATHVLSLDHAWLSRHNPGELIERTDGDITGISEFYSQVVLQVVAAGILLVGVLVLVTAQDWRAGLVFLAFSVLALTVLRRSRDHAVPAATAHREASAELFGSIEERLAGLEDVRGERRRPARDAALPRSERRRVPRACVRRVARCRGRHVELRDVRGGDGALAADRGVAVRLRPDLDRHRLPAVPVDPARARGRSRSSPTSCARCNRQGRAPRGSPSCSTCGRRSSTARATTCRRARSRSRSNGSRSRTATGRSRSTTSRSRCPPATSWAWSGAPAAARARSPA